MVGAVPRSRILCHRGIWSHHEERNTKDALLGALELGFGIETDIRDHLGEVVISHDPVGSGSHPKLDDLQLWATKVNAPVALNVKSDGLHGLLSAQGFPENVFFFDMSIPEKVQFQRAGFLVASRASEYESLELSESTPLWLDSFHSDWFLKEGIWSSVLESARFRPVIIVSPELHSRPPESVWRKFRESSKANNLLSICTDRPFEVENYEI